MAKNCPACDASGRVPTDPGELCKACLWIARATLSRKVDGRFAPADAEFYGRPDKTLAIRRLTLELIDRVGVYEATGRMPGLDSQRRAKR